MNSTDERLYYEWLASVCEHIEELMDCTAEAQLDALILKFKPFGRVAWYMRFEDAWLLRGYQNNANPKAIARSMAIATREEWVEVITRNDTHND